jgi:hypothetical protein
MDHRDDVIEKDDWRKMIENIFRKFFQVKVIEARPVGPFLWFLVLDF